MSPSSPPPHPSVDRPSAPGVLWPPPLQPCGEHCWTKTGEGMPITLVLVMTAEAILLRRWKLCIGALSTEKRKRQVGNVFARISDGSGKDWTYRSCSESLTYERGSRMFVIAVAFCLEASGVLASSEDKPWKAVRQATRDASDSTRQDFPLIQVVTFAVAPYIVNGGWSSVEAIRCGVRIRLLGC